MWGKVQASRVHARPSVMLRDPTNSVGQAFEPRETIGTREHQRHALGL